jgi:hypothetical protein
MISLVFLVCFNQGCISYASEVTFESMEQCDAAAYMILTESEKAIAKGEVPPHKALYRCINWIDPI